MIRNYLLWICLFFISGVQVQDNLDLNKMQGSINSTNIFKSNDYYARGASIVKCNMQGATYFIPVDRMAHTTSRVILNYICNGFRNGINIPK